jgi:hypothetical protein
MGFRGDDFLEDSGGEEESDVPYHGADYDEDDMSEVS